MLVNARDAKGFKARKTDVIDAEWLADLLRHGLLKPSFIPPLHIRELRELTRYRESLVREQTVLSNATCGLLWCRRRGRHRIRKGRTLRHSISGWSSGWGRRKHWWR